MKRMTVLFAVTFIVFAFEAAAQRSHLVAPAGFEQYQSQDMGVHVLGPWPYVWFDPNNSSASSNGWNSCWIQMNVTETNAANGDFMLFSITSGKRFYFNQEVDIKSKLGLGVTQAAADIDVTKTSTTSVSGRFVNLDSSTGEASLLLQAGNGTSSSKKAYTEYATSEGTTASRWWFAGMVGTTDYKIRDYTNTDQMTISQPDANGVVNITFNGTVNGGVIHANYQDVAEWVPAAETLEAGTVVVLNPTHVNEVMRSTKAYDTKAAGVVSAQPGVVLGQPGPSKAQVATTGRVKVKVDASTAAIEIGDLLVTSGRPGHAMKSEPVDVGGLKIHRPGTVVGKALEPLPNGQGEILVLLTLQ